MDQHFNYRNIAISSLPGAGRSTLLANLKTILQPLGWNFFSGGEWSRQYAIEHGLHDANNKVHHLATAYSDEVDLQIDKGMAEKLTKEDHYIVESWIAGFNMRNVPGVLKVLLLCDTALRIDRIVNRDSLGVEEAKEHMRQRQETNVSKWKRMYAVDDFWDPKYYDVVIDTYSSGPMETLGKVLDKLGYKNHNK